ncbi:MAG: potassium-transporting ATPase subunit KdpA [Actinobacteria bacterium]|nr:potassium-transporting ATPase subunit KdpA [Actinomycetota bacterium]
MGEHPATDCSDSWSDNANSAHPFENPDGITNLLQMVLCVSLGRMHRITARDRRADWPSPLKRCSRWVHRASRSSVARRVSPAQPYSAAVAAATVSSPRARWVSPSERRARQSSTWSS